MPILWLSLLLRDSCYIEKNNCLNAHANSEFNYTKSLHTIKVVYKFRTSKIQVKKKRVYLRMQYHL